MLNTVKVRHSLPRKRQISSEFILHIVANDVSITIQFLSHLGPNTSPDMSYAQQLVMVRAFGRHYLSNAVVLAFQQQLKPDGFT